MDAIDIIDAKYDDVKASTLSYIAALRSRLRQLERSVLNDEYVLNDLGELQSQSTILDCRIATLAVLRALRRERDGRG